MVVLLPFSYFIIHNLTASYFMGFKLLNYLYLYEIIVYLERIALFKRAETFGNIITITLSTACFWNTKSYYKFS